VKTTSVSWAMKNREKAFLSSNRFHVDGGSRYNGKITRLLQGQVWDDK